MNYVPDFVSERFLEYGVWGVVMGMLSFCAVIVVLHIFTHFDKESCLHLWDKSRWFLLVLSIALSIAIVYRTRGMVLHRVIGFVMLFYMMVCSITDYYMKQVYDVIQLGVCVMLAAISFLQRIHPACGAELIVFALLQAFLFRRMYGEGDVMCFLLCALSLADRGILVWTCHMGLSFLLLGVIQAGKHNIAADGNLRLPVPFFPYMAVAYFIIYSQLPYLVPHA